jgi:hypothetical protein
MSAIIQKPRVMKFPPLFPYCCAGCSAVENSNRQYYVDLGFMEFEYGQGAGTLYLCNICLGHFVNDLQNIILEKNKTLADVVFSSPVESVSNGFGRTDTIPDEPESTTVDSSTGIVESTEHSEPTTGLSTVYFPGR